MMQTLAEFLLEQISDDEADAKLARGHRYITGREEERSGVWVHDGSISYEDSPSEDVIDWVYDEASAHIARWDPARVLAECDAKRRIVERCNSLEAEGTRASMADADYIRAALALPYADRADYQPEWRP
jgi:hypothetical protein